MKNKKVLVVAAHPDDEILGCGATMARLCAEGHEVQTLIMAEGITSRSAERDTHTKKEEMNHLHHICQEANKRLGVEKVHFLGLPDNRMDSVELLDITKQVEAIFSSFKPHLIFTHHHGDLNIDHRLTYQAVLTAARPLPQAQQDILFFEVPSATAWMPTGDNTSLFNPQVYYDISGEPLRRKLQALEIYTDEMRPFPHARSVEAVDHLARFRGSQIGLMSAEAFAVGRILR